MPGRRRDGKKEGKPRSSCLVRGANEEEREKACAGEEDGQKGRGADRTKWVSEGVSEGG